MRTKLQKVLSCEHIDEPVWLVLSDTEGNIRCESFTDAQAEYLKRMLHKEQGLQMWADYGDYEIRCDPTTGRENPEVVNQTGPLYTKVP